MPEEHVRIAFGHVGDDLLRNVRIGLRVLELGDDLAAEDATRLVDLGHRHLETEPPVGAGWLVGLVRNGHVDRVPVGALGGCRRFRRSLRSCRRRRRWCSVAALAVVSGVVAAGASVAALVVSAASPSRRRHRMPQRRARARRPASLAWTSVEPWAFGSPPSSAWRATVRVPSPQDRPTEMNIVFCRGLRQTRLGFWRPARRGEPLTSVRAMGARPDARLRLGGGPRRRCRRRPPPASPPGRRCAGAPGPPRCPPSGSRHRRSAFGGIEQIDVHMAKQLVVRQLQEHTMTSPDQALGIEGRRRPRQAARRARAVWPLRPPAGRRLAPPRPRAADSATRGSRCSRPGTAPTPSPDDGYPCGAPVATVPRRCPRQARVASRSNRRW